jgi:hypothetical protein
VPTAKSAKPRRKRCLNDNKFFVPKPNVPDQKFCCDPCRKEFHRHGSAFGPMKLGLYSAIDKKYAALERMLRQHMRTGTMKAILETLANFNRDVESVRKRVERLEALNVERAQAHAKAQVR